MVKHKAQRIRRGKKKKRRGTTDEEQAHTHKAHTVQYLSRESSVVPEGWHFGTTAGLGE